MTRTSKVERAHRVLAQYLDPRLQPGVSINWRPFLIGCDDRNVAQRIPEIVGAVCRATAGDLAMDSSVNELTRKLKEAVEPDGTKTEAPPVDEDIVNRVLLLLEARLTNSELLEVKRLLTEKKQRAPAHNPEQIGEDAKSARLAFDAYAGRFPSAARIKIEPTCAPAPQRQMQSSSMSDYAKRFPGALRIGQA